nr:hypothetical protein [Tanacetum cinerariifolium]
MSTCLMVIRGSQTMSDTVLKHDLCKLVIVEVRTAITDDGTGGSKPSKERFQEFANNSSVVGGERFCLNPFRQSSGGVFTARKPLTFSKLATMDPPGDIMARTTPLERCLTPNSIGPQSTMMPMTYSNLMTLVNVRERFRNEMKCLKIPSKERFRNEMKCHKIPSKFVRFLTFGASTS